jgi:hypothetical protein
MTDLSADDQALLDKLNVTVAAANEAATMTAAICRRACGS